MSAELIFLSGFHLISNQSLKVYEFRALAIHPWKEGQNVRIECQPKAGIYFLNVMELNIDSLIFTSCMVNYNGYIWQ